MSANRATKSAQRGIQSIDVGGKLLATLMAQTGPMALKDLSTDAGIASAQAHAYLSSFKRLDLVVQNQPDGRYAMGPLALHLGLSYIAGYAPLRNAREATLAISQETGLMTVLVVWSNGGPTAIEVRPGREQLNVNVQPGSVFPVTGSSVGFIFAAFEPRGSTETRKLAELSGAQSSGGQWRLQPKEFSKRVTETKSLGFASLAGQPIFGISSLSVPVFGRDNEFVAAIMLMGNEDSLKQASDSNFAQLMKSHIARAAGIVGNE